MKKCFTLFIVLMMYSAVFAQGYVFTDKNGNVYEDGATITRTEVENEDIEMPQINSDLFVKNDGAPANSKVAIVADITKIDNGLVQLCFPTECNSYSATGQQETSKTSLPQGESQNIMSEWMPNEVGAYGECSVTYTAKTYDGMLARTFSVTVNYKYVNPTGIEAVSQQAPHKAVRRYNLLGNQVKGSQRGLSIVLMSDGRVRKVITK